MAKTLTSVQQALVERVRAHGRDNPVAPKDLADVLGITAEKAARAISVEIRELVDVVRLKGYPICASGDGFWWPADDRELSEFITAYQAKISREQQILEAIKGGFEIIGGELRRPEEDEMLMYRWKDPASGYARAFYVRKGDLERWLEDHPGAVPFDDD